MNLNQNPQNRSLLEMIRHNKHLFISEGIAFTLLGIFALIMPTIFSLTLDYFLGWLFVIGALITGARTIRTPTMPNRRSSIISTLLYLFLGFMFLAYPIAGIETLTLLLGFFFIFDGILKIYGSFQIKAVPAWHLILLSGVLSLVLAIIIIASWPTDTPWVLGFLVGINLLATGIATLGFLWKLSKY